jgi:N-acetylneuraminic acid mutarotase
MHYARAAHAVVGDGKSLYALAGTGASGAPVLVFERFDARTWHDEGSIPRPGLNARAAVVLEGTIHALGGGNSKSTIADHDVFDPAKNAWTTLAPLPRAEGSPAAVAFGGKLYAIGGRRGPSDFGAVDIYDAVTNQWSKGPSIDPRGTAGAVVYCDAI